MHINDIIINMNNNDSATASAISIFVLLKKKDLMNFYIILNKSLCMIKFFNVKLFTNK